MLGSKDPEPELEAFLPVSRTVEQGSSKAPGTSFCHQDKRMAHFLIVSICVSVWMCACECTHWAAFILLCTAWHSWPMPTAPNSYTLLTRSKAQSHQIQKTDDFRCDFNLVLCVVLLLFEFRSGALFLFCFVLIGLIHSRLVSNSVCSRIWLWILAILPWPLEY